MKSKSLPKPIEKIKMWEGIPNNNYNHNIAFGIVMDKLNQLIDAVNYLLEKK